MDETSDEAFNRQYGNQFIAGSSLLLGAASLQKLTENQIEFKHKEIPEFDDAEIDYSGLLWQPGFNLDEIEEDYNYWVFSVDIAEGVGGDYSVINIFQDTIKIIFLFYLIELYVFYKKLHFY